MQSLLMLMTLFGCGQSAPAEGTVAAHHCDDRDYSGYCYDLVDAKYADLGQALAACGKLDDAAGPAPGPCPADGGPLGPRLLVCSLSNGVEASLYTTTHKTKEKAASDCEELKAVF